MRVAFVQRRTAHLEETALARRTRRTAELLAERGHEAIVCCARWWDGGVREFEENDVTYHAVSRNPSGEGFAARLPPVLRRIRPDVIHVGIDAPTTVLAARTGAAISRSPIVADWFGAPLDGPVRIRRSAVRSPSTLFVPSEYVKMHALERGAHEDAVRVVPESIDFSLVREIEPAGDSEIVYSRRLDADANAEALLLALAEFRDRDWHATIIGDGPERESYEQQSRDLRIDDRVSFAGALPVKERVARFKRAHVFVQTATRCPFATELLWALACGCVGVVDYQAKSSAHELVERRERGIRTTGEEEIAEAFETAADLPRMETNEEFADFDHGVVLEEYLECYRNVREGYGLF